MSEQKRLPAPEQLQGDMDQYLSGPEAEKNEKALSDALITKAKLEELGVPVPAQLQVQIDELQAAKNPLSKLPKWASKTEWVKVLQARKATLEGAIAALGNMEPASSMLRAEIARIDSKLVEPKEELGGVSRAGYAKKVTKVLGLEDVTESKPEKTLTPEQVEQLLNTLEERFNANKNRHEKVEWAKVKSSLEANPEALWSINEMEKVGHEPDVYFADDKGFDVGTCCKESPEQHRNIVYDAEARGGDDDLRSAEEIAEKMGIDVMEPDKWEKELQAHGEYDLNTYSWLKTSKEKRKTGAALSGARTSGVVRVNQRYAVYHRGFMGWRGSLRVLWKKS